MWSRQHAWLSTPDTEDGVIRWSQLANETTALPELSEWMEVLAVNLLEAGPVLASETGWSKIPWAEFKAWRAVTEADLTVWESQLLMAASAAYAAAINEYYQKSVNAPYMRKLTKRDKEIEKARAEKALEAQIDTAWIGPENNA